MNIETQYNKVVEQNRSLQWELRETRKVLQEICDYKPRNYETFAEIMETLREKARKVL